MASTFSVSAYSLSADPQAAACNSDAYLLDTQMLNTLMAVFMIKWCFELSTPLTFYSDILLYLITFVKIEGYPDISVYSHT